MRDDLSLDLIQANGQLAQIIQTDPTMISVHLTNAAYNLRLLLDRAEDALNGDENGALVKTLAMARQQLDIVETNSDAAGKAVDFLLDATAGAADALQTLRDQRNDLLAERDELLDQIEPLNDARTEAYERGVADAMEDENLVAEYDVQFMLNEAYDEGHAEGHKEGAADRILNAEPARGSDAWLLWHTLLTEDERAQWRSGLDPEARADYDAWVAQNASA